MPSLAYLSDEDGAAAVEFSLVFSAFVMFIVGSFYVAGMLFVGSSMQFATQAAARCASVDTTNCATNTAIQSYAATKYSGGKLATPIFVASTPTCGHQVTASVTYSLDVGMRKISVPLSAASCFP
jgi:Flp pilus assembly protein TadG